MSTKDDRGDRSGGLGSLAGLGVRAISLPLRPVARVAAATADAVGDAALSTLDAVLASSFADRAVHHVLASPLVDSTARHAGESGVIGRVTDRLLADGTAEQIVDRVLSGPELERLMVATLESANVQAAVARTLEGEPAEQLVARVLDSAAIERLVTQVLDSRLLDEIITGLLASRELWLLVEEIAESPAVSAAVTQQGFGYADQLGGEMRRRSRRADARLETLGRRLLRRPDGDGTPGDAPTASRK